MKFKENDLVLCVNDTGTNSLRVGKIYRVTDANHIQSVEVSDKDSNEIVGVYSSSRFILANKFKAGDTVKCINNGDRPTITTGKIYRVLDASKYSIKIYNDSKKIDYYDVSRFELVKAKRSFNLSIEEDNIEDFLYKLKNAYNIVSDVARTERDYEEAYLKLEALLNDKTDPLDLF